MDPIAGTGLVVRVLGLASRVLGKNFTWRLRLAWLVRSSAPFPVPRRRLWKGLRRFGQPLELDRALTEPANVAGQLRSDLEGAKAWKDLSNAEAMSRCIELVELLREQLPAASAVEQVTRIAGERAEREVGYQSDRLATLIQNRSGRALDPSVAEQLPAYMFMDLAALVSSVRDAQNLVDALLLPDPVPTLKAWAVNPPTWLDGSGPESWVVFGHALSAHGLVQESAQAWQRAIDEGAVPVPYWQARRAMMFADDIPAGLAALPRDAETSSDPFVRGVHAALVGRSQDALDAFTAWQPEHPRDAELRSQLRANLLAGLGRVDEAIQVLDDAIPTSQAAALPLLMAQLLLSRAQHGVSLNRGRDLRRAADLATLARDRRRNWRGDSGQPVKVLADALILAGDMSTAWTVLRPEPEGTATQAEADDPRLLPNLAMAAAATGHRRVADDVASRLEPFDRAWVKALLISEQPPSPDADEGTHRAWRDQVEAAWRVAGEQAGSDEQILMAGHAAAAAGVLLDQLEPLRDRFPEEVRQYEDLARAADDPVRLRALQATSIPAAVRLSQLLVRSGDHAKAASVLIAAAERFGDDALRLMAADQLALGGQYAQAGDQARQVAITNDAASGLRQRALQLLVEVAQWLGDWPAMATSARELLVMPQAGDEPRWALAVALASQSRTEEAWKVLSGVNGPPRPTSPERAGLLIALQQRHATTSDLVRSGIDAFRQFGEDEQFAAFVIHAMITGGIDRSVDASPLNDTERTELQHAMQTFFERFPDSDYLFRIDASDVVAVMGRVTEMLKPGAEAIAELSDLVQDGALPLGMLASAVGKSYTEAVVQRAAGGIQMQSSNRAEQESERVELRARADQRVIVDVSALHTMTLLDRTVQELCIGLHDEAIVIDPVLRDMTRGRDAFALRATGAFVYDRSLGRATVRQWTQQEADQAADQSAAMLELALRLARIPWPELVELVDLDDEAFESWAAPIDAAKATGLMLWSDDVAQRRLARQSGVEAFGTMTLLEYLTETTQLTLQQRQNAVDELVWNGAADLAFDVSRWRRIAERDEWQPRSAALMFSRSSAWAEPLDTLRLLDEALQHASGDEQAVGGWIAHGLRGLLRATIAEKRLENLGLVLARFWSRNMHSVNRFCTILDAARWASDQAGIGDPLPGAILHMHALLSKHIGEAAAATHILRLAECATTVDRQKIAETILSGPNS